MVPKAKTKMFPELPSLGSGEEILPLVPFLEAACGPLTCAPHVPQLEGKRGWGVGSVTSSMTQ